MTAAAHSTVRIRVLEDSRESGLFLFRVRCSEPRLLAFWRQKPAFRNGRLEQTGAWPRAPDPAEAGGSGGMDFLVRVVSREPDMPNGEYWVPFVLALCQDARSLRYRLPENATSGCDIQRILAGGGELVLIR